MNPNNPLTQLRHDVSGAIERGKCEAIVEKPAPHYVIFPNVLRFAPSPKLYGYDGWEACGKAVLDHGLGMLWYFKRELQ